MLALVAAPSPLWYATRSAGTISLLLLTAVMVLGLATSGRVEVGSRWRFLIHGLHRNLSLLAVLFLGIHVVTAVLDPYARLGLRDALVPFASAYRPLWLGLGVVSVYLVAALVITSLVRDRIGSRLWRAVHWCAYLCWPVALLHGLGTGSDARQAWFYGLCALSVSAVFTGILAWRLRNGSPADLHLRTGAGIAALAGLAILGGWAFTGPLQPGWAKAAGTPPDLIRAKSLAATPPLATGLADPVQGRVANVGNGYEIDVADSADAGLVVRITVPTQEATTGMVAVFRNGVSLCTFDAQLTNPVRGSCGSTALSVQLAINRSGGVSGRLTTGTAASV